MGRIGVPHTPGASICKLLAAIQLPAIELDDYKSVTKNAVVCFPVACNIMWSYPSWFPCNLHDYASIHRHILQYKLMDTFIRKHPSGQYYIQVILLLPLSIQLPPKLVHCEMS